MADDDLITIVSPDDMTLGYDPVTGMPRAEPTGRGATARPDGTKAGSPIDPKEFEQIKTRLSEIEAEKNRLANEAKNAKQAAAKHQKDADTNTDYALRTHWRNVNLEYEVAVKDYNKAVDDAAQLDSWVTATKGYQAQAKIDLQRAIEAGDAAAQADANERMGTAAAQLLALDEGKRGAERVSEEKKYQATQKRKQIDDTARQLQAIEQQPKKKAEPAKAAPQPPAQPAGPKNADEFISQAPEKVKDWLQEHRDFATPGTKQHERIQAFALMWMKDNDDSRGSTLNTDDFRRALDEKFFPAAADGGRAVADDVKVVNPQAQPQAQQQRAAPVIAPVSRAGTPGSPSQPGRIQLSQDEYNIAPNIATKEDWNGFDEDLKQRFGNWSETAARYQYERWLRKAKVEKGHRFS